MVQQVIHYFLHFIFPLGIALFFFRKKWKKTYLVFLLTMLVDIDHLLANPVFSACRCSIGFHALHSYPAIVIYIFMLGHPKLMLIAIGLLMHMATDYIDCLFINFNCK
ncbi:hypothetical protein CAP36_11800 [Chitinophagaceae bacterium IBVUCB2]|nr:hypothetical protein CAP36_11800 [Chitinophagaceae bacterium IBVUCB2]